MGLLIYKIQFLIRRGHMWVGPRWRSALGKWKAIKRHLDVSSLKEKHLLVMEITKYFKMFMVIVTFFGIFVALRAVLYFPKRQVSTSQVLFDVGNGNKKDKEQTSKQQENKSKQDESQMETIFRKRREILQNFCQIDKWKNRMVVEKGEFHIYNNSKIGTIFCMYYFFFKL